MVFDLWRHALFNGSQAGGRGADGAGQWDEGGAGVTHHPQALGAAYMADGVHPEALGHALWADIMIHTFRKVCAGEGGREGGKAGGHSGEAGRQVGKAGRRAGRQAAEWCSGKVWHSGIPYLWPYEKAASADVAIHTCLPARRLRQPAGSLRVLHYFCHHQ